ncbi:MAG: hypothetical protein GY940_28585 [bacterium]|nr:hypothetical protein [bacterium]
MKTWFIFIAAFISLGIMGHAITADEVIQNNLKARGGLAKIDAIKSLRITGKVVRSGSELDLDIWLKRPDKVRAEVLVSGRKIIQVRDGEVYWAVRPFAGITEPTIVTNSAGKMFVAFYDLIDSPLAHYKKKGHKAELLGKEKVEGKDAYGVKLTLKNNAVYTFYFDAKTFHQVKQVTYHEISGQSRQFDEFPTDYRKVAGVLFSYRLKSLLDGQDMGPTNYESFEANAKMEDDLFKFPAKK